jgi:hypothetical protein
MIHTATGRLFAVPKRGIENGNAGLIRGHWIPWRNVILNSLNLPDLYRNRTVAMGLKQNL